MDVQRIRADQLETEKNKALRDLELQRSHHVDEQSRLNFEMQELQLTIEKLQQEKARLTAELDEILSERARGPIDFHSPSETIALAKVAAITRSDMLEPRVRSSNECVALTHSTYRDMIDEHPSTLAHSVVYQISLRKKQKNLHGYWKSITWSQLLLNRTRSE